MNARLERLLACQRDHTALLAANAEHTRGLLDNLPAAVLGVDPDGLVAYANLMADSTLADAGGLLGRPLGKVLPDFDPTAAGTRAMDLAGRPHLVRGHPLGAGSASRGQLLILLHQPIPIDR